MIDSVPSSEFEFQKYHTIMFDIVAILKQS